MHGRRHGVVHRLLLPPARPQERDQGAQEQGNEVLEEHVIRMESVVSLF
jgi:hypothetical protein